jgi:N-methylhydantoinase B
MAVQLHEFGKPHAHLGPVQVKRAPFTVPEPALEVDPITYEIVKHRIWYAGLSLGETLKKVSGTVVTAEANDMSSYITLEDGAPVFLGPYVIFHCGNADLIVSNVIKLNKDDPGIRDGDMFFVNDPWLGPAHQPDCAIVAPIFIDGELFCWTGLTVHQLDMGGVNPGGLCPDARDVYAEPTLYPAVKIVEEGRFRTDIDRMLQRNSRMPGIVALDIRSMIAGNNTCRRDILRLTDQYGKDVVKSVMVMMIKKTSEKFRSRLAELPHGTFRSRDWNEIGGSAPELQDEVYLTECTMTNTGEKLIFDFSGTSPQCTGFANCGIGGQRSGVISGFAEPVAFDIPWNAGLLENVEIITQEGTINNPRYPAALSDGITEGAIVTAACSAGVVMRMLLGHEELRNKTLMNSGAAFLGNTLGGINERGDFWGTLLLDVIGMCSPCTGKRDGKSITGSGGIPYTQFSNVETQELHYPFLYLFRRLSPDAWGHGRYRGGRSVELSFTPHKTDFIWMLLWNHGAEFANAGGVSGGLGASAVRFKHAKGTDIADRWKAGTMPQSIEDFPNEVLKAKSSNMLSPSDVIYFGVPGSSGYGDPILREPERVLADVEEGILSPEHALRFYGVVVEGNPPQLSLAATQAARAKAREIRSTYGRYLEEWDQLAPPEAELRPPPRSPRAERKPPAPTRVLFALGLGLQVVRDASGSHWWVCSECGHVHCPVDQNPKEHALIRVGYLSEMSHPTAEMARRNPPRFFQRQFYCPGCVLMFTNEMARAEDPILNDVEYDAEWLSGLD